jgi:hypothetical protein
MGIEEQVGDTLRLALAKYWTFFGVSGLLLILVAAADGIPKWVALEPLWQWLVFAIGFALLLACAAAVFLDARTAKTVGRPDLADVVATVLTPGDRETVQSPFILVGSLGKPMPEGCELWLFGVAGDAPASWWPQTRAQVNGTSWTCEARNRWTQGMDAPYEMAVVGPDGQALVGTYLELNHSCQGISGKWAGALTRLTSDMQVCSARRRVRWDATN